MKKFIALLSLSFMIITVANAQDSTQAKKTKKERVQNHVQDMDSTQKQKYKDKGITKENLKDLDLTPEQKKQVDDIVVNSKKEKDQIRNDNSLDEAQKEEKLKQIDKDSKEKLHGILTPEQREKIKKKRAKGKPAK